MRVILHTHTCSVFMLLILYSLCADAGGQDARFGGVCQAIVYTGQYGQGVFIPNHSRLILKCGSILRPGVETS